MAIDFDFKEPVKGFDQEFLYLFLKKYGASRSNRIDAIPSIFRTWVPNVHMDEQHRIVARLKAQLAEVEGYQLAQLERPAGLLQC